MPPPKIIKKRKIEVGRGSPPWMTTYGDLMTQILIFFVMMFALASAMNEMQLIKLRRKIQAYVDANKFNKSLVKRGRAFITGHSIGLECEETHLFSPMKN